MENRKTCLVVLSGGQDSTTCLFWAAQRYEKIMAISFNYGQRHILELQAAALVAKLCPRVVSHQTVMVGNLLEGRSPLTNPKEALEQYTDFESMDKTIGSRVELTFVPLRNLLFLTLAANHAVCNGVFDLVTGVCQADNANYPDCRDSFVYAAECTLNQAMGFENIGNPNQIGILTPLMDLTKAQSVKLALSLPGCYEALAFSHTAYDGVYPPIGRDHATILRAHGFEEANIPDPLITRAVYDGRMQLPNTANYDEVKSLFQVTSMGGWDQFAKMLCNRIGAAVAESR